MFRAIQLANKHFDILIHRFFIIHDISNEYFICCQNLTWEQLLGPFQGFFILFSLLGARQLPRQKLHLAQQFAIRCGCSYILVLTSNLPRVSSVTSVSLKHLEPGTSNPTLYIFANASAGSGRSQLVVCTLYRVSKIHTMHER